MGGHGGLNILPQKRWNVYNYENREKVRRDEEAAAKEEQLKREQSRKRDSEFRLEQLRTARGLAPIAGPDPAEPNSNSNAYSKSESDSGHINLFEGIRIFDQAPAVEEREREAAVKKRKKVEPAPVVVTAEDEKYRVGYGLVGKGVKLPWYLEKRRSEEKETGEEQRLRPRNEARRGKKTVEEMREERLQREKREKERARALMRRK